MQLSMAKHPTVTTFVKSYGCVSTVLKDSVPGGQNSAAALGFSSVSFALSQYAGCTTVLRTFSLATTELRDHP